ncbi:MAG: hypothetical protein U0166_03510 [Acidobacteriota bacterium]
MRSARVAPGLSASSVNPGGLDRADLLLMHEAGFRSITLSVESGSGPVLDRMKKGFGADAVRKVAQALCGVPLRALWVFLELWRDARDDARVARLPRGRPASRRWGLPRIFPAAGVRVYADIELHAELGWPRESLLDQRCYFSPDLDRREAFEMLTSFQRDHPEVVILFETSSRFEPWAVRLPRRSESVLPTGASLATSTAWGSPCSAAGPRARAWSQPVEEP